MNTEKEKTISKTSDFIESGNIVCVRMLMNVFVYFKPFSTMGNLQNIQSDSKSSRGVVFKLDNRVTFDNGLANPPTTFIYGPKYLASYLYPLSPIQDWALATTLVRPIYFFSLNDVSKEIVLSNKKYGSVRRAYIVAAEDEVLKKEFQQLMIKKNPPNEVEEISGSDHMPMMSKPLQLFTHLTRISNRYS
nr:methylesterase 3-like [Solanum lycopersicum]